MLRNFKGGDKVKGGFYFNTRDWTMRVAPSEGEVLPGADDARYVAFPAAMMLVAAPLLSFMFVIFLPFIGIALLVKAGMDKFGVVAREARHAKAGEPLHSRVTK